jgi:ABC-2 type transport system ATP-binding protein
MIMSELVVETRDLRRTFGKKDEIEAVAGVDLDVAAGSIIGLLGPKGAGKTTNLRKLATLQPP